MYTITVTYEEEYTSPSTYEFSYLSLEAMKADLNNIFEEYLWRSECRITIEGGD